MPGQLPKEGPTSEQHVGIAPNPSPFGKANAIGIRLRIRLTRGASPAWKFPNEEGLQVSDPRTARGLDGLSIVSQTLA